MLTSHDLAAFHRDGYLVIERFAGARACEQLMRRAGELVDEFERDFGSEETVVFRAHDGALNSDRYFLESADAVRCFFEEGAFDASGRLGRPVAQSINKIGHALHDLDPTFAQFSRAPRVRALIDRLGLERPLLLQSMYIFKQPRIGGEVTYHQDATYLYTEPQSVVGLWWALEDASRENGCLWVWPGGHRVGLKSRLLRSADHAVRYEYYDRTPWPGDAFVPLEVARGTLVVLHGLLPHGSERNRSPVSRHAYSVHIIDGACAYPADNWLRRGLALPLRGFDDSG